MSEDRFAKTREFIGMAKRAVVGNIRDPLGTWAARVDGWTRAAAAELDKAQAEPTRAEFISWCERLVAGAEASITEIDGLALHGAMGVIAAREKWEGRIIAYREMIARLRDDPAAAEEATENGEAEAAG